MMQIETHGRVLVVDDDQNFVALLERVLEDSGCAVAVAYTGYQAVERSREHEHDLILMDIRMPGMDGIEAFREIKRRSPESCIVFMTGYASSSIAYEARLGGPIEKIVRPLDLEKVADLIEEAAVQRGALVIEHEPGTCRSLQKDLEERALEVRVARNAEEAIVLFERKPRQVVILENGLKESGLIIKEVTPTLLVTLLSGIEASGGLPDGEIMPRVLTKPFEPERLVQTVRLAISRGDTSLD